MRQLDANEFVLGRGSDRRSIMVTIYNFVMRLSADDAWYIVVKRFRNDRSDKQNKTLWGLAYKVISEHTGYEKDEVHDILLRLYFGEVEREILGVKVTRPKRTTTTDEQGRKRLLDTTELKHYFEWIQRWAAETVGLYIPDPDPEYWREKESKRKTEPVARAA